MSFDSLPKPKELLVRFQNYIKANPVQAFLLQQYPNLAGLV